MSEAKTAPDWYECPEHGCGESCGCADGYPVFLDPARLALWRENVLPVPDNWVEIYANPRKK